MSSEHEDQVALFDWVRTDGIRKAPELGLLMAIPNGAKLPYKGKGKRRWSPEAQRLKAEGLHPGVPDIFLPVARCGYYGLWIEMKHGKNRLTDSQREFLPKLEKQGYQVIVCHSPLEAIYQLAQYLDFDIDPFDLPFDLRFSQGISDE